MVGYRPVTGGDHLYHHLGRCYFRMKPKEKEREPRVEEGQTHKYVAGAPGSSHA